MFGTLEEKNGSWFLTFVAIVSESDLSESWFFSVLEMLRLLGFKETLSSFSNPKALFLAASSASSTVLAPTKPVPKVIYPTCIRTRTIYFL
jgi:hypothetical protein